LVSWLQEREREIEKQEYGRRRSHSGVFCFECMSNQSSAIECTVYFFKKMEIKPAERHNHQIQITAKRIARCQRMLTEKEKEIERQNRIRKVDWSKINLPSYFSGKHHIIMRGEKKKK
jgi:hypothetical protein